MYDRLGEAGLDVDVVRPYVSAPLDDPGPAAALAGAVADAIGRTDEVTAALGEDGPVAIAAVGPVTAAAVEEHGWVARIVPDTHRTGALVRALEAWAAR